VVFYAKLFPVIIFLTGALLLFQSKQEKAAFILLFFLPVVSIISAPGVLGGLGCFAVYLFLKKRRKEALQLVGLCLLSGTFFFLFYSVLNTPGSSPYKTHLSDNISHLISPERLFSASQLWGKTALQLLLTFGPFLIITALLAGRKTIRSLNSEAFLTGFFIFLASLFTWVIMEKMMDSRQFFTNLGVPILNLGLLLALRAVLQISKFRFAFLALVLVNLGLNFSETAKYMNIVPKTSPEYQKLVGEAVRNLNPVGGFFKTKDEYNLVYFKASNIFPLGTYLAFEPETQTHHTVNLAVFEIPITTENEAMETQFVQNTSFYKFVAEQKTIGSFKSLPESQLAFIRRFKLDYLLITKSAALPEILAGIAVLKHTDPLSGEKLYLLK
jgi:hypothetical protein